MHGEKDEGIEDEPARAEAGASTSAAAAYLKRLRPQEDEEENILEALAESDEEGAEYIPIKKRRQAAESAAAKSVRIILVSKTH